MNTMRAALIGLFMLSTPASPGVPSANGVAQSLELHYRHLRTLAAVFLEKYTSGGDALRAESGKVYFLRPGRMRWDYESPEKKLFLVDGKNVWYYVPGGHTASRTKIKESDDWRTPLALLTGKVKLERLCGVLRLASNADAGDPEMMPSEPGNTVLVCTPHKNQEDYFRLVLLEINPRDQLVRLTVRQAGGIEEEFRFGDWREDIPLNESEFHFEPPAGVAIVDDAALADQAQHR